MKALSLTQPWASMVAAGLKQVETRSWSTSHRGAIAIHAAKGYPRAAQRFAETYRAIGRCPSRLPLGAVIATARLVDVRPTDGLKVSALERRLGNYAPGRFAWFLEGIEPLADPVPVRGMLGLWEWPSGAGG